VLASPNIFLETIYVFSLSVTTSTHRQRRKQRTSLPASPAALVRRSPSLFVFGFSVWSVRKVSWSSEQPYSEGSASDTRRKISGATEYTIQERKTSQRRRGCKVTKQQTETTH